MSPEIEELKKEYKFDVEGENILGIFIDKIYFEDGREYHLQHPSFMELHRLISDTSDLQHTIFEYGLKKLIPKNDKSPVINEDYLSTHRIEGFELWSKLVRGLLLRGSLT